MHRVLYFIVRAESEREAVDMATESFEDELKAEYRTTYDYCKPMESGHRVAGSDRWSDFKGDPISAPMTEQTARDWVDDALDYTERHFAENLYGMFQHMIQCLDDSVETAPKATDEILEFVHENHDEMSWSEGGETLREEWPRTVTALYEGEGTDMHRYYAGCLRDNNPMVGHIMDCYTYGHLTVADGGHHLENVEELLDERPQDAWVVPVDAHH